MAWNCLEGVVALIVGGLAGSISLVGFGIDSFIEVTSGATLLWRMTVDAEEQTRERNEKFSLRIVGTCFLALSAYMAYESVADLISAKAPEIAFQRSLSPVCLWLYCRFFHAHKNGWTRN